MFKIVGEDEEYKPLKIYRRRVEKAKPKPSGQQLLFRLLDLRLENKADGEAYFELLEEYMDKASRESLIDYEKLREYISKIELLRDYETLSKLKKLTLKTVVEEG